MEGEYEMICLVGWCTPVDLEVKLRMERGKGKRDETDHDSTAYDNCERLVSLAPFPTERKLCIQIIHISI
jgi:hypothetical protein